MFIDIEGCPVSYETFVSSFKPRGNVADDVMIAHAHVYNEEAKISTLKKPFMKKYMFSSFIVVSVTTLYIVLLFYVWIAFLFILLSYFVSSLPGKADARYTEFRQEICCCSIYKDLS